MKHRSIKKYFFLFLMAALSVNVVLAVVFGFYFMKCYVDPSERINLRIEGDFPYMQDDEVGYVPVKSGKALRRNVLTGTQNHLFTDSRGARVNREGEETPDEVDVLFVGGSFLWGIGMDNEHTTPQLLSKRLGLRVANITLSGYGTLQALQMLRRNLDLRPKVIVYGFIEDHARRNISPCAPNLIPYCLPVSYVSFAPGSSPYIASPIDRKDAFQFNRQYFESVLMAEDITLGEVFLRMEVDISNVLRRMHIDLLNLVKSEELSYRNNPETRFDSLNFLLGEMEQTAKSVDAKLVVMHIPYMEHRYMTNPPPDELKRAGEGRDIVLLDLSPVVMAHYMKKDSPILTLGYDPHPNTLGHELMAEELAKLLQDMIP